MRVGQGVSNSPAFCARNRHEFFYSTELLLVPEWEALLFLGTPSPLRISGIIDLAGNREIIYGLQLLAGKILSRSDLGHIPPASSDRHYCERLHDDQAKLLWTARSDVTRLQMQIVEISRFILKRHSYQTLVCFTAGSTSYRFSPEFRSSPALSTTTVDRF